MIINCNIKAILFVAFSLLVCCKAVSDSSDNTLDSFPKEQVNVEASDTGFFSLKVGNTYAIYEFALKMSDKNT